MERIKGFCPTCGNSITQSVSSFSDDETVIDATIADACSQCGNNEVNKLYFLPAEPEVRDETF